MSFVASKVKKMLLQKRFPVHESRGGSSGAVGEGRKVIWTDPSDILSNMLSVVWIGEVLVWNFS